MLVAQNTRSTCLFARLLTNSLPRKTEHDMIMIKQSWTQWLAVIEVYCKSGDRNSQRNRSQVSMPLHKTHQHFQRISILQLNLHKVGTDMASCTFMPSHIKGISPLCEQCCAMEHSCTCMHTRTCCRLLEQLQYCSMHSSHANICMHNDSLATIGFGLACTQGCEPPAQD